MAAGVYTACEYSYIYIYIYIICAEYRIRNRKEPGNTSMGYQVSDLFSPPTFDFAPLVFLAEFYVRPLELRGPRPRYLLLRRAGGWEMENRLWCSAPGPQSGQRVGRAWGFLKPRRPCFSPSRSFCPWVLRQRFPEAAKERSLLALREPSGSQSPSLSHSFPGQVRAIVLPGTQPAFLPQRQSPRPVPGILLAPESPSPGLA